LELSLIISTSGDDAAIQFNPRMSEKRLMDNTHGHFRRQATQSQVANRRRRVLET
jgi:hypothetical protein